MNTDTPESEAIILSLLKNTTGIPVDSPQWQAHKAAIRGLERSRDAKDAVIQSWINHHRELQAKFEKAEAERDGARNALSFAEAALRKLEDRVKLYDECNALAAVPVEATSETPETDHENCTSEKYDGEEIPGYDYVSSEFARRLEVSRNAIEAEREVLKKEHRRVFTEFEGRACKMVAQLRAALSKAAERFEEYARIHVNKGTPEGVAKSAENLYMAGLCRDALAGKAHQ